MYLFYIEIFSESSKIISILPKLFNSSVPLNAKEILAEIIKQFLKVKWFYLIFKLFLDLNTEIILIHNQFIYLWFEVNIGFLKIKLQNMAYKFTKIYQKLFKITLKFVVANIRSDISYL